MTKVIPFGMLPHMVCQDAKVDVDTTKLRDLCLL